MCTVQEKLQNSLVAFIKSHKILLVQDVKEETISHAIASCMSEIFEGWDVDPEYNRFGVQQKKKLIGISKQRFLQYKNEGVIPTYNITIEELYQNPEAAPVFPDIIVHKRTEEFNNLLIVEVKKEKNPNCLTAGMSGKFSFLCALSSISSVLTWF
jgi:hypothetical protein